MPDQTLKFDVTYSVPCEVIYRTLTDQLEVCRFTQGQAVSETTVGGKLMMYDGMITGTYTKLEQNTLIEMTWRMKDWADECLS